MLERHLDRHFRQNASKTPSKILSRKWYQSETSWIVRAETEVAGSLDPGAIFFDQTLSLDHHESLAQQQQQQQQQLQQQLSHSLSGSNLNYNTSSDLLHTSSIGSADDDYIEPVTVNPEQQTCPLCKEDLEQKFDSDLQEWVYDDAVQHRQTHLIAHRFCMPALVASNTNGNSGSNVGEKRARDSSYAGDSSQQHQYATNGAPPTKRIKTE